MRRDRRSELRTGGCCRRRAELEALSALMAVKVLSPVPFQGERSSTSPEGSRAPWPEFFWRVPGLLLPAEGPLLQGRSCASVSRPRQQRPNTARGGALGCPGSAGMDTDQGLPAAPRPGAALHRHPEMLQPGQSPLTAQKQPKEQLECLGMSARWVCRGAQTAIPGATSWSSHTPTWGPGDARGVSPALSSPRPLLPSLPAAAKEGGHSES
ncbi:uncharacterized protein LOC134550822 isoform X2 [Prinia subflava]|uniref:uncharacterized protein LOC134550822 isoform X2 n=1 Tax=Prinia subflava TaxID=208062 RepID=UPI002FDFA96E